jgi:hypothetical protein
MLYRGLSVFFVFLFFLGCASADKKTNTPKAGMPSSATITFVNKTPFRAHITVGSMAVELKSIEPGEKIVVPNIYKKTEAFYFSYDISLLPNNYDLLNVHPLVAASYIYIDNAVLSQEINITPPPSFDLSDSYIVIANKGQKGGVFLSENISSRLVCIHPHQKNNITQGESEVFSIRPAENKVLYLSGSVMYAFPVINYQPAWVYFFLFDGNAVIPTDARPLSEIGKNTPVTIKFTGYPLSEQARKIITDGLQNAVQTFGSPFEFNADTLIQTGYSFTVNINYFLANVFNNTVIKTDTTVNFSLGENTLCQTASFSISEISELMLAHRIAERLRDNQVFFNKVNEAIW